ncbi:MAG TPA: lytic transglycosylase domain-containing protein [Bryobacteraceae bacterium]|nr:lytic transglycosylase domain-containing protein [Bryobacteraceae bacterium]
MRFSADTSMNPASLLSHIGEGIPISSKLVMVFMLLGGGLASAQSTSPDIASRMRISIQRQQASILAMKASIDARVRSGSAKSEMNAHGGFFLLPPVDTLANAPAPQCNALPQPEVDELVTRAGEASSVPADLLRSVMKQESGFRPCAVSGKGAMGLMQLMQATANDMGVRDAFDPQENVTAGAKFLKQLINLYGGDLTLALSAYNAGPARVNSSLGVPAIPETMDYVNRVLSVVPISESVKSPNFVMSTLEE